MGGKLKQRTKGNTKPSSSGRAAELLSRDGSTGFVGFGDAGSASDGSSLQFFPANSDPEVSVHADFLVVMKKLTKRDAITKLKAVQEFGELCKTSAMEAVLSALPYWPRLYNKLALDIDYRVREAAQHAMNQIASRAGRKFAPNLKSVMGVWMCSQCDTYIPVATAAQKAFSVAFSESKQAEVLGFCKKEITEYLQDNLMNQTADTLSDPDMVEEKDRVTKFIRVTSSSLQALGKFIIMVNDEVNMQMYHYHEALTAQKKFWKLGKHKAPQIRASFFSLVTVYCQKLPGIVQTCSSSVCPIVLGSLDEADATVCSALWEAVLQVVSTIKDFWQYVNIEKAMLPKFWHFLSNGAYGSANVVMVSLLPFVSKLPDEVVFQSPGFSQKMFSKLIDGLKQVKVQQSLSECKAVVSAFMDCVKYIVVHGKTKWEESLSEDERQQLGINIIDQVMTVIDLSLAPAPKSLISCTSLYERLGDFLTDSDDVDDVRNYFWNVFGNLIYEKVQCSDIKAKENEIIFQSIVKCLSSLKSPGMSSAKSKTCTKVRFQESSDDDSKHTGNIKLQHKPRQRKRDSDVDVTKLYGGKLLNTVSRTSCLCLKRVLEENSGSHLVLLTELVNQFCSATLLKDLVDDLAVLITQEDSECCDVHPEHDQLSHLSKRCINIFVLPLIGRTGHERVCKDKWLVSLVQLLFVLLDQVDEEYQKCALESVFEVNCSSELLYLIVNEIFQAGLFLYLSCIHGLEIGRRVVEVLKSSVFSSSQEASNAIDGGYIWRILDLCFAHMNVLGFFFNQDSLNDIFQVFHSTLTEDHAVLSNLIPLLQVLEKFVQNTEVHSNQFGREQDLLNNVVLDILQLRFHGYNEQSHLSRCWHSVVNAAISDDAWLEKLVTQTTQAINDHLHSSESTTLEHFCDFTRTSIEIIRSLNLESSGLFLKILPDLFPTAAEWDNFRLTTSSQSLWSIAPFFDGELNFTEAPLFSCVNTKQQLTAHHRICLFLAHMLKEILPCTNDAQVELDSSEHEWRIVVALELLWMRECLQRTPSIHGETIRSSLLVNFEASLQPLLEWITSTDTEPLLLALLNKSQAQGGLWSLTLKSVIAGIYSNSTTSVQLDTLITTCQSGYNQHTLQTLQSLLASDTSIYNLKLIVDSYTKKWKETETSDSLGQMFCLSLISCTFERWADLTKDSEIGTLECRMTLLDLLEDIKTRKDTFENLLLFSCSLDDVEIPVLSFNMAIIRIFKLAVSCYSMYISGEQWDMILCSMLDWLQSCQESNLVFIHVSAMTNHVCQLIANVGKVLCNDSPSLKKPSVDESMKTEQTTSPDGVEEKPLIEKLADEWREFFSNSACGNLLRLWSTVAETDMSKDPSSFVSFHHLSEALSAACTYLSVDNLKEHTTSLSGPAAKCAENSSWEEDFLREFSPHLKSTFSAFQITSYRLLLKVMPLVASHNESKKQPSGKEDDVARPPPSEIMFVITNGQRKLPEVFSEAEVPFGETLDMAEDVEALHISRSFLLAWKLFLSYFVSCSEEVRVEYANYLRREKYLNELLEILFRILPKKPSDGKRMVEESRSVEEKYLLDEDFVHCLAFEAYYDLLRTLPALVRQWWTNLDKNQAAIVERYTTSNVSPLLCEKEMQAVQRTSATYDNMNVVTRSSTREVIAYYQIEGISIELIVSLSASHPLGLITVSSGKRVGVKINQWRLWMMQLTTFLMHQNGTIMEALTLWKRNVDKKFEGVDDCMICFSVIHGSNYSLPRLSCRTCKKKFHSACLYRWFSTSNNSTCPLCRNLF